MIQVQLQPNDLLSARYAHNPLLELALTLRGLFTGRLSPQADYLARNIKLTLSERSAEVLSIWIRPNYIADIFAPIYSSSIKSTEIFSDQLEQLRSLSADELSSELRVANQLAVLQNPRLRALSLQVIDSPQRYLTALIDVFHRLWTNGCRVQWEQTKETLRDEIRRQGQIAAEQGWFNGLEMLGAQIGIGITMDCLKVYKPLELRVQSGGFGLVFMPTTTLEGPPMVSFNTTKPICVCYPVKPLSNKSKREKPSLESLGSLLGHTTAKLLFSLSKAATTTDLAHHFGVSAPAISQHLKVLRTNGLIESRRSGRNVLHQLSDVGCQLLRTT